jgi:adenine/guanine phosphoribosyltransferase-like PRPP-binding protein
MDLAKFLRDVPDFPKPGILFKDITPLLASPAAMRAAIDQLAALDLRARSTRSPRSNRAASCSACRWR